MTLTYILLRNNQESQPLSIDQLKAMGLLSDDLVWVEGQSVYWLPPAQIPELKAFVSEKPASTEPLPGVVAQKQPSPTPTVSDHPQWDAYLPKQNETDSPQAPVVFPEPERTNHSTTVKRKLPAFSKPLLYTLLVAGGIAAGLLMNRRSHKTAVVSPSPVTTPTNNSALSADSVVSVTDSTPAVVTSHSVASVPGTDTVLQKTPTVTKTTVPADHNDPNVATIPKTTRSDSTADVSPAHIEEKPDTPDFSGMVTATTNDYFVASFGGIRNLEITVVNHSKYTLTKVVVEIDYLKPRDEFLRSEKLVFHQVPPNDKMTLPVEKSNRGVKVTCKVIQAIPEQAGF